MPTGFLQNLKTPRKGRFSFTQSICLAGAALLVLSWLTTEHFLPWVSWHAEALSFAAVFLAAWAAIAVIVRRKSSRRIAVPLLVAPFVLISAVALGQILTGTMTFWGDAIVVWFYMAMCITCVLLGYNTKAGSVAETGLTEGTTWPPPTWLALAFVIGSLGSVVVAFAQVFDLWEYSGWIVRMPELRRPGGNLGQPNQLATLLVMGIASAAFLHVSGKLGNWPSALIVSVLCAGLAVTESRAGALELMALLFWWQFKRRTIATHVSPWIAAGVALGFVALFSAWPHLLNVSQLSNVEAANRFTHSDLRLAMWSQLLEAVWQRPWWGWGITEVAKAHNSVAHAHPVNNPFSYSHNVVIDWAVWMGLPVALILTSGAALWLWRRSRAASQLLPWYCLAVMVPLATHSMLEFPFAYAYFLAPALYLLGVLEASLGVKTRFRIGTKVAAATLFLLSTAMLWSMAEYLAIEEDFRIVRFEQLRIGKTPNDHHRPDVILLTQLSALLTGSRIDVGPDMAPEKLQELKKLALRYPWVATQYRYALALALNGNPQEATRQFQVIRWQRDEKLYEKLKREVNELAQSRYPELRTLQLP